MHLRGQTRRLPFKNFYKKEPSKEFKTHGFWIFGRLTQNSNNAKTGLKTSPPGYAQIRRHPVC